MSLLDGHWPWWLGAIALASVAVGHRWALGRTFGVSGVLAHVLDVRGGLAAERSAAVLADAEALDAALLAATRAEFGADAVPAGGATADESERRPPLVVDPGMTWTSRVVFLLGIGAGGLLSAALVGTEGSRGLGPVFEAVVGSGPVGLMALVVGGVLVGFGTQMAGGCTSGHGLNGCARVQPGSLLATATFFGVAILVSLLLAEVAA